MSDLLPSHQQSAFLLLAGLLSERGPIGRDELRILVASQGVQLGRDYVRFRELELIEEIEVRPSFLRRLLGAKAKVLVTLTERGRTIAAPSATQGGDQVDPQAAVAAVETTVPEEAKKSLQKAEPAAEEPPPSQQAERLPAATESVSEAIVGVVPEQQTSDVPLQLKTRAPKRFALGDYTDVLGGVPEDAPVTIMQDERLNGLAELLGLLGLEITPAGELLAGKRWSQGHVDADIALEISVVAVAHAARLSHMGTAVLSADEMLAQIDTVIAALGKLVPEGQLTDQQIAESLQAMKMFVLAGQEALSGINELLSDPLRGIAPPATFPDDVWIAADHGDEVI